jgi:poly(3-hydroxybutyrate) depolymerase
MRYHVPSGCSSYRLQVVLHGGGMAQTGSNDVGTGVDIRVLADFESSNGGDSDANCVIVAYPDSGKRVKSGNSCSTQGEYQWNFTPSMNYVNPDCDGHSTDDSSFVNELPTWFGNNYTIISGRTSVVGFSGGGFLLMKMNCVGYINYRYAWAVASGLVSDDYTSSNCYPGTTTPKYLMMVNGTGEQSGGVAYAGTSDFLNMGLDLAAAVDTWSMLADKMASGQTHYGDAVQGTIDGYTSFIEYYAGTVQGCCGGPAYTRATLLAVTGSCSSTSPSSCDISPNPAYDCEGSGCNYDTSARPQTSTGRGGAHRWPGSPCGIAGADPGLPNGASGACSGAVAGSWVQSNAMGLSWLIVNQLVNSTSD